MKAENQKNLQNLLCDVLTSEIERLPELLEQLEPRERAKVVIQLLPLILPKGERVVTGWEV